MGSEYSITYPRLRGKGMAHTIERLTPKAEPKKISVSLWVVLNNNESSVPQDWGQALFGLVRWPRICDAKARPPAPESTQFFHVCTHVAVEHQKTFTKEGGKTQKGPWTWPGLPPERNILGEEVASRGRMLAAQMFTQLAHWPGGGKWK